MFAEVLNETLENIHKSITGKVYMLNELEYTMSTNYHDWSTPHDYKENYRKIMSSFDPKSKMYPDYKIYVDNEIAKFTGKLADRGDGETQSSMSGPKKPIIKS